MEVYREAVAPGERRRYTKRFLDTREGDFGQWTEREWRILARLIGHGITCVPEVVQFDRGRIGGMRIVQTYDAGVTVDQWATLLPVIRDDRVYRHVFEDCAHWWALAQHCLLALQEIHRLELVHLDIKGDNVCIPYAPANFDPESPDLSLRPVFAQFALIDFAFALVSKESLTTPLPIGWQREYDYQSPRLLAALEKGRDGDLQATRELDWRCDMYSLAAMLKRYLPDGAQDARGARAGWTPPRYDSAKALILRIREAHDAESPARRPHAELIETTSAALSEADLVRSLDRGWSLARELTVAATSPSPLTPVTRLAPVTRIASPVHVTRSGRTAVTVAVPVPGDPAAHVVAADA
ncbi:MAG TPA: serine/threonine-protein kinase, partial [Caldimonas sp.]|nr:serine/threonine-protein kinase [Caldimonas sp.]